MNLVPTSIRNFVRSIATPQAPKAVEVSKKDEFTVDTDIFTRAYNDAVKIEAARINVPTDQLKERSASSGYHLASSILGPLGAVALAAETMKGLISKEQEEKVAQDMKLPGRLVSLPGSSVLALLDESTPLAGVMMNRVQLNPLMDQAKHVDPMASYLIGQQISHVENRTSLGKLGVNTLLGELRDEKIGASIVDQAQANAYRWERESALASDRAGIDYAVSQGFSPDAVLARMRLMNSVPDPAPCDYRPTPEARMAAMEMHFADKYAAAAR